MSTIPIEITLGDDPSPIQVILEKQTGEKGDDGASIVSADFEGDDIVFTKDDSTTVVLEDAKLELKGDTGAQGVQGEAGVGVPVGGATGQVLAKASNTDYDTAWVNAGSGGGAVDSVNGQTGVVVLDADDIDDAETTHKFVTSTDITNLSNLSGTNTGDQDLSGYELLSNKENTTIDNNTTKYPTVNLLKTGLDAKQDALVSGTNIKTINTQSILGSGDITIGGSATWGSITGTLSTQTDLQTVLDGKVDENSAITGATKTKITYDAKGLVTAGADATTADIADSTDKRYVTDAQLTVIGNTSGTNTGDQVLPTRDSLGLDTDDTVTFANLSGTNTGDQDLSGYALSSSLATVATTGSYTDLSSIPSTFTPSAHTHVASDVTDFATAVAANSAVTANTAKVTNATHTGDVTGATTLTIANDAVTPAKMSSAAKIGTITFQLNGQGSAITTSLVANTLRASYGCTITKWEMDSVESGSIVIDILKNGSSITASAKPTLSSATNAESSTLTGWTTTIAAEDKIDIVVDSATTVEHVTLTVYVVRT
jgi:hypothetical protein